MEEDIVIVGAEIGGLATSLGLHNTGILGVSSVVLESADSLRTSGYALGIWSNGWKALDAIGVGVAHILRAKHHKLNGKDNVCVIGDALHPMTPDIAQGGCSALEDSVVLARLLGEALKRNDEENERGAIREALEKMARERRWRCFDLISTSYVVGVMQQSDGVLLQFFRDKLMAKFLAGVLLKKASFDCGYLTVS